MKRHQLTSKGIHGIFCRFESRIHKGRQHQEPMAWKHLLNLTQWQTIGLAIILLLVPALAFGGESTMKVYSSNRSGGIALGERRGVSQGLG